MWKFNYYLHSIINIDNETSIGRSIICGIIFYRCWLSAFLNYVTVTLYLSSLQSEFICWLFFWYLINLPLLNCTSSFYCFISFCIIFFFLEKRFEFLINLFRKKFLARMHYQREWVYGKHTVIVIGLWKQSLRNLLTKVVRRLNLKNKIIHCLMLYRYSLYTESFVSVRIIWFASIVMLLKT